jgi:hypothetical protein
MTFVRYKKFGKQEYAYEVKASWDAEKKKPIQKTRYLGVVKDKDKKISNKQEKCILDFGDSFAVNNCLEETGFNSFIKEIFKEKSESLLALLAYKLCHGSAMTYANKWLDGNYAKILYKNSNISSQRISDLFKYFGDENLQRKFFKEYISNYNPSKSGIIIDVTSLPNQIHIPLSAWGLHGEEIDKQIRFLLVVDKDTHLPLFFRILPGNIVDVSALEKTLEELKKYDVKNNFVCLDAGFFSEDNIKDFYEREIDFLTRLPSSRIIYKQLIEEEIPRIESAKNIVRYGKRGLFIKQKETELFGNKAYAHVVLDPQRKGRETSKLILETIDEKSLHNETELDYSLMKRGVMILVSSSEISKEEVVKIYYLRQTAENLFGFSKDDLGLLPLRVHSEEALRGFLFIQFLTLIAFIQLRNKLGNEFTVEEALLILRNLKCKIYDNEAIVSELTRSQKDISEKFNVLMPKQVGI